MKHLIELSPRKRYLVDKYVNEALHTDRLEHLIVIDKRRLLVDLSFVHKEETVDICHEHVDFEDWLNASSSEVNDSLILVESFNEIKNDHNKYMRIQRSLHELTSRHNVVILLD